jgi:hypothetical protein
MVSHHGCRNGALETWSRTCLITAVETGALEA